MRLKFLQILIFALVTALPLNLISGDEIKDAKLKAYFLYNFTKFITWPKMAIEENDTFTIGIVGKSNIKQYLDQIAETKKAKNKKMVIRTFKNSAEIEFTHILFVPSNNSQNFDLVLIKTKNYPTLIVAEKKGLAKMGSAINFLIIDNKIRFEINQKSFHKAEIKVDSQLLKLAAEIY